MKLAVVESNLVDLAFLFQSRKKKSDVTVFSVLVIKIQ